MISHPAQDFPNVEELALFARDLDILPPA